MILGWCLCHPVLLNQEMIIYEQVIGEQAFLINMDKSPQVKHKFSFPIKRLMQSSIHQKFPGDAVRVQTVDSTIIYVISRLLHLTTLKVIKLDFADGMMFDTPAFVDIVPLYPGSNLWNTYVQLNSESALLHALFCFAIK